MQIAVDCFTVFLIYPFINKAASKVDLNRITQSTAFVQVDCNVRNFSELMERFQTGKSRIRVIYWVQNIEETAKPW